MTPTDDEKQALRNRMRDALRAMDPPDRAARSRLVCDRLLEAPRLSLARTVMVYLPMTTEADITPFTRACLDRGQTICAPRVDWASGEMTPIALRDHADMGPGARAVPEPAGDRVVPDGAIDAAVVPGLAFDAMGGRLGRGGGHYDRFLHRLGAPGRVWCCAAAFDAQIVGRVPTDPHDVRMHAVACESRLILLD